MRLRGLTALMVCAGAVVAASATMPAAGQSPAGWSVSTGNSACAVEYNSPDPEDGLFFSLQMRGDASLAMSGSMFDRYTSTKKSPESMEVTAGDRRLVLLGSDDAMEAYADQRRFSSPVEDFIALAADHDEAILVVDGQSTSIPLAGLDDIKMQYAECRVGMLGASAASAPILRGFDGINQVGAAAARERLLSEALLFTLNVDEAGQVTGCSLSRKFRRKATELALCRPMMKYTRFDPARDAQGNPVAGDYEMKVDFNMWMTQRGYLEAEDR